MIAGNHRVGAGFLFLFLQTMWKVAAPATNFSAPRFLTLPGLAALIG